MEIERKYLITEIPPDLPIQKTRSIEQGYLCTSPVVRIRRDDDDYILTYKSSGLMVREEYNLPLTREAYEHLKAKADGRIIEKVRHVIPLKGTGLFIELDVFGGDLAPLMLAEVEFPTEEMARAFQPPAWFGEDVTFSPPLPQQHPQPHLNGKTDPQAADPFFFLLSFLLHKRQRKSLVHRVHGLVDILLVDQDRDPDL